MDQSRVPLLERMIQHAQKRNVSFHVPGHKGGRSYNTGLVQPFYQSLLPLDLTEISGMDDLHDAEGVIKEAQKLAAELFGADHTSFLVGGSTSGNLALILSICNPGDLIIVDRNVHKSVIHGLMLARAKAVFVDSELDSEFGIPLGIRFNQLQHMLKTYPEAKAVFLTNPNYYGVGRELGPVIEMVHQYRIPVLVDEAHGAHYGFHPALPARALMAGADAVVQSPHKMLTAMTMSGMLHIKGERVDRNKVLYRLQMIQSSSPSYPLLASIDWSRKVMAKQGHEWIVAGLKVVANFRENMRQLPGFILNTPEITPPYTQDPFKVLIKTRSGLLNGSELQKELEKRGCFMEMALPNFVLAVFTLTSTNEDAERLFLSLQEIHERFKLDNAAPNSGFNETNKPASLAEAEWMDSSRPIIPIDFGCFSEYDTVELPLDEAIGSRSAQSVTPYPPGIPLLFPGEWITEEKVKALKYLINNKIKIQGLRENQTKIIAIS